MAMLARIQPLKQLVNEMLDQLSKSVWRSKTTTFLDPAIGGGQFVAEIERRLRAAGHSDENIKSRVFGFEYSLALIDIAINMNKLVGTYRKMPYEDFFKWDTDMKFDVVVGNPPYQDGNKSGQQNKLYNLFAKKALALLSPTGILAFITPGSVCKKSKRFSIIGQYGLSYVNFASTNFFTEGVNICSWIINRAKDSKIKVIASDLTTAYVNKGEVIFDKAVIDPEISNTSQNIKNYTADTTSRMFLRNNPGPTKRAVKDAEFKYPLWHVNKDKSETISCYVKKIPFFHGKRKIILSMTKSLSEESVIVSTKDYDDSNVCFAVSSESEIENIKSFIFSKYFTAFVQKWKALDGYGFNESIKYLPPFDTEKQWSNASVKAFLEKFSNVK